MTTPEAPAPLDLAAVARVATGAIALPVVVVEHTETSVTLAAPHDVTCDGKAAVVAAVRKAFPAISVFVTLDAPPAAP